MVSHSLISRQLPILLRFILPMGIIAERNSVSEQADYSQVCTLGGNIRHALDGHQEARRRCCSSRPPEQGVVIVLAHATYNNSR